MITTTTSTPMTSTTKIGNQLVAGLTIPAGKLSALTGQAAADAV